MAEFSTVKGMQDFLGERARKKQFIQDVCRDVFQSFGFQPFETPIVEDFALLSKKDSAGEAIKEEIYYFKDKADRELGLRFDLTVPLARVIANNPMLPKPFKRYQIERVYRYDKPQKQRYREFTQADIDILGVKGMQAETECLAASVQILQRLNVKPVLRVNNRKLLEDLALQCAINPNQIETCFRLLDKADKISWKDLVQEFKKENLSPRLLDVVKKNDINEIKKLIPSSEGLKELMDLQERLKAVNLHSFIAIDFTLCRGLAYYTGTVLEVASGKFSVGGGGRYDGLIEKYGGQSTPAVGISFGVDRLLDVLEEKLKVSELIDVYLIPIGESAFSEAQKLALQLRQEGINTDIDLMNRSLSKNMEYANKNKVSFIAVIGDNEIKAQTFKLKNMITGDEVTVKFTELETVKGFLNSPEC